MNESLLTTSTKAIIFVAGFVIIGIIGLIIDYKRCKRCGYRNNKYVNENESNFTLYLLLLWTCFGGMLLLSL